MTLYKYRDSYSPGDGVVVDCCNLHRRRHVVLAHPLRPSPVGPVHLPLSVEGGPPVSQVTYSTLAAITKGNSRTAQSKRARGTTMDLPRALACVVFNVARHGPVPFSDLLPSTNRYLSAREGTSKAGGRQTGVSGRTGSVGLQVDDVVVFVASDFKATHQISSHHTRPYFIIPPAFHRAAAADGSRRLLSARQRSAATNN